MSAIGVIGLLLAIACLIILSYKGVNAFIASLIASLVVVVTNLLPFWETFSGAYATGLKNFVGNYFLLFGLDTLPHCSTFILMCSVCGVTAKDSYKHVFPLTVVMPILLTVLCILMISVGII